MSTNISLRELRAKLSATPETKAMIRPSTKNAIYLDVDGDGPADFAFICSDLFGDTLDTFAIDVSNDGDFDVYVKNCMDAANAQTVVYPINSDKPMNIVPEGAAKEKFAQLSKLPAQLTGLDVQSLVKVLQQMKQDIAGDYKAGNFSALQ